MSRLAGVMEPQSLILRGLRLHSECVNSDRKADIVIFIIHSPSKAGGQQEKISGGLERDFHSAR